MPANACRERNAAYFDRARAMKSAELLHLSQPVTEGNFVKSTGVENLPLDAPFDAVFRLSARHDASVVGILTRSPFVTVYKQYDSTRFRSLVLY